MFGLGAESSYPLMDCCAVLRATSTATQWKRRRVGKLPVAPSLLLHTYYIRASRHRFQTPPRAPKEIISMPMCLWWWGREEEKSISLRRSEGGGGRGMLLGEEKEEGDHTLNQVDGRGGASLTFASTLWISSPSSYPSPTPHQSDVSSLISRRRMKKKEEKIKFPGGKTLA